MADFLVDRFGNRLTRGPHGVRLVTPRAAPQSWSQQLRAITGFNAIWSMDDPAQRVVTGSDVDTLKESGGTTDLDLIYESGTKATVGTRDGITVIDGNGVSVVMRTVAAGTLADIWASGKGTIYAAGYWTDEGSGEQLYLRSGDGSSWGLDLYTNAGDARAYAYDGSLHTLTGGDQSGWHQICFKLDGINATFYLDGTQVDIEGCGAIAYLAGRMNLFYTGAYSSPNDEIAIIAFSADNEAHNDTLRNQIEDKLRDFMPNLP